MEKIQERALRFITDDSSYEKIRYQGAVMWNHLPKHIRTPENIETFKKLIRSWKGLQCKCAFCKYANENTDHS